MRKAIIEDSTGNVLNVIVLKSGVPYEVLPGQSLIDAEDSNAEPGGHWDGLVFTRKPVVPPTPDAIRLHDLGQRMVGGLAGLPEVQEFIVLRHRIVLDEVE